MFNRVDDLAEKVATHVSRRAFLGRLGQGCLGLAVAMAGVLTTAATARAGTGKSCCSYCWPINPGDSYKVCLQGSCPATGPKGGILCSSVAVTGCAQCH
jgi:hypothetical protein